MTETKKCPKCGSEMVSVFSLDSYGEVRIKKVGDLYGDHIIPYNCKQCGYIELYNDKYLKPQTNKDK